MNIFMLLDISLAQTAIVTILTLIDDASSVDDQMLLQVLPSSVAAAAPRASGTGRGDSGRIGAHLVGLALSWSMLL